MEIEIDLHAPVSTDEIYALRKYLEEHVEGLHLEIQAQAPIPGSMIIAEISAGVFKAVWDQAGKSGAKWCMKQGKKLVELITDWSLKNNSGQQLQSIEPGVTIKDGASKYYFQNDEKGTLQVYDNFEFAIDPEMTYAILIGVSEFQDDFPPIPPVRKNLVELYELLVDKRHIGIPRKNIQVIWNKTDNEIKTALLKMSRIPGMETFLIYYSGHGYKSDVKNLSLTATNTTRVDDVMLGDISFDFLKEKVIRPSTAKQKILILDACHSGIATQGNEMDPALHLEVKGSYILTSSGDEASYFEKQADHTYFTGALLELLKSGNGDPSKEYLSLSDIFENTNERLASRNKNLPSPRHESQLNISPQLFYLARNPSFSPEKLKSIPKRMMKEGKTEEALKEYKKLVRRYPDDAILAREKNACELEVDFIKLVREGDRLYHQAQDHRTAAGQYQEALSLKYDSVVADKLRICKEQIPPEPVKLTLPDPPKPSPVMEKPGIPLGGTAVAPPKPATQAKIIKSTVSRLEDEAIIIGEGQEMKKLLYSDITSIIFYRYKNELALTDRQTGINKKAELIRFNDLVAADNLKNVLVAKRQFKLQPSKAEAPQVVGVLLGAGLASVIYWGIITWGVKAEAENKTGIIHGLAEIIAGIGSFITPLFLLIIMVIYAVVHSISETINYRRARQTETYS